MVCGVNKGVFMFKEMIALLSKSGKRSLAVSSLFFAVYGIVSAGMIVIVFSTLAMIAGRQGIAAQIPYFAGLGLLVVIRGLCNMAADKEKHNAGFDIVQQIRERMIIKLKQFSLGFYTDEKLGEINTILHKDADTMSMVVGHVWSRMFGDFLAAAAIFAFLAVTDTVLAVLMAAAMIPALSFLAYSLKQAKRIEKENNSALIDMVNLFVEYVRGIPVLKSFANNTLLDSSLAQKTEGFGKTSARAAAFKAAELSVFAFLLDCAYCVLLIFGTIFVLRGRLSVQSFIIFAVLSKEFYKPFAQMETHYMYYVAASDSYKRLEKILYGAVIADKTDGIIPVRNDIAFMDVGFSYHQDDFRLEHIDFRIGEKTMTALVGESGSGKTTITHLLLRFYEVHGGSITVGGTDIRDIPYDELLNRISIVMQNVQLFDTSIEENIRVGKKGASKEAIIKACKKARIHDFIMSLPDGYETHIGENGALLSGGQRQRISIARAFLKDAPILILDEMTSNVDPVNEALIQEAVTELAKNRTVLVIAHHLKTIQHADQILVFKKGMLVEKGKHRELLAKQGYYAQLWKAGV